MLPNIECLVTNFVVDVSRKNIILSDNNSQDNQIQYPSHFNCVTLKTFWMHGTLENIGA